MKYAKPPLSFEDQADRLIKRGLVADKGLLIARLNNVNYYRLSGYLYPYRQPESDLFKLGTTLEKVWDHYTFDRQLRLLVMDAIERIEVSLRTQLIYALARETKAFGYIRPESVPKLTAENYVRWIKAITDETGRSREDFVAHFRKKYGDDQRWLPVWMAGELMSFGSLVTFYSGVAPAIKRELAEYYGIPDEVLSNWLQVINVVRNICAHHGRLWNREMGYKFLLPYGRKYPAWHKPVSVLATARVAKATLLAKIPVLKDRLDEFFEKTATDDLVCKIDIEKLIDRSSLSGSAKKELHASTQQPHRVFVILTIAQHMLKVIAPQSQWRTRLFMLLDKYPEISRWSMGFPDNWKECPIWQ